MEASRNLRLRRLHAFCDIPGTGAGVSRTARDLLSAMSATGHPVDLFTSYLAGDLSADFPVHQVVPPALRVLPYSALQSLFRNRLGRKFLDACQPEDIAYLWLMPPLSIYEALGQRGVPIVAELVNTRMEHARAILDAAYYSLGLPPAHGITDRRIADQNLRLGMADAIFAASPMIESSLDGAGLAARVLPASFGTHVPASLPPRPRRDGPVTVLFLGRLCVRKGAHVLLRAWQKAPSAARLRIVGEIEPAIREIFADILNREDVSCAGYVTDVRAEILAADIAVLPSLEEGDPIATYEAAAHGLAVIASRPGAGRIGAETGAVRMVNTNDVRDLRAALQELVSDEDLRREWGDRARAASFAYDWSAVARRRLDTLAHFLAGTGR